MEGLKEELNALLMEALTTKDNKDRIIFNKYGIMVLKSLALAIPYHFINKLKKGFDKK